MIRKLASIATDAAIRAVGFDLGDTLAAPAPRGTWPELLRALCNIDIRVCDRCGCQAVGRRPLSEPLLPSPQITDTS